jgi:mannose-6-phosphate isomerase
MGTSCEHDKVLPLLVKLIDAKSDLSVQVHPDDEYAMRTEGEPGKTEMWYVIDCARGAELIYGFKEKVTSEQFAKMIKDNTLLEYVNRVRVKKGDVFFIPSGTLHAIGKGILIAEIQQNSNTTYRVYDYGRVGADGKPRELHINKAIDVTNTRPAAIPKMPQAEKHQGYCCTLLAQCKYFTAVKYDVASQAELDIDHRSFAHLMVIDGQGEIDGSASKKGDSFFIDASSGSVKINGRCSFILSRKL